MVQTRYAAMLFVNPFLLAVLLTGAVVGCGSPAAPEAAKAGGFPADIPIYDGLERDYVSDSGALLVVNGTTSDDIHKVTAFYRERMPAKGWTERIDPTAGGGGESLFFEMGTAKLNVLVSKDLGKTRVSVQVEGYEGVNKGP